MPDCVGDRGPDRRLSTSMGELDFEEDELIAADISKEECTLQLACIIAFTVKSDTHASIGALSRIPWLNASVVLFPSIMS